MICRIKADSGCKVLFNMPIPTKYVSWAANKLSMHNIELSYVRYDFEMSAEDYFGAVYSYLCENLIDTSDLNGSDLENAELSLLRDQIYHKLVLDYGLNKDMVLAINVSDVNDAEVRLWYNPDEQKNRQRVIFSIGLINL